MDKRADGFAVLLVLVMAASASLCVAQDASYPSKAITMVLPWPAGAGTNVTYFIAGGGSMGV
jgi:tripartite-type tricarboxylate transporter receptor subunit TctC